MTHSITLTVEVTCEDQMCGVPESCTRCPVAAAVQRILPEWAQQDSVFVTSVGVSFTQLGHCGQYFANTPSSFYKFIHDTDSGKLPDLPPAETLEFKYLELGYDKKDIAQ